MHAPATNGGAAITSYTATASPGGAHASAPACPITVTGLTDGTGYTFTVTATSSLGTSVPSAASNKVTPVDTHPPTRARWAERQVRRHRSRHLVASVDRQHRCRPLRARPERDRDREHPDWYDASDDARNPAARDERLHRSCLRRRRQRERIEQLGDGQADAGAEDRSALGAGVGVEVVRLAAARPARCAAEDAEAATALVRRLAQLAAAPLPRRIEKPPCGGFSVAGL